MGSDASNKTLTFKSRLKITGDKGRKILSIDTCFFEIPDVLAETIEYGLKQPRTVDDLAERLRVLEPDLSCDEAQDIILSEIVGNGLLVGEDAPKTDSLMTVHFPLMPEALVAGVARFTKVIFRPTLFKVVVGLGIVSIIFSVLYGLIPSPAEVATTTLYFSANDIAIIWFTTGVGIFCHEFGHASALSAYGKRPGPIGVGVFYILLVFYSDTSRAWELEPSKRIWVDLGGVYAQLILHIILTLAAIDVLSIPVLQSEHLQILMLANIMGILTNLVPFFMFDGNWLASDIFGINNMHQKGRALLAVLWRRWVKKDNDSQPDLDHLKPMMQKALFVLLAMSQIVMAFFILYVIAFSFTFFSEMPEIFLLRLKLIEESAFGDISTTVITLIQLLAMVIIGLGLVMFYLRHARNLLEIIRSRFRRSGGSQPNFPTT